MSKKQPRWKKPLYSKTEINRAGNVVRNLDFSELSISETIKIIDNWRESHAYPMHVIYIALRRMARNYNNAIVVERLKRRDSIVAKLQKERQMELWRMQDLGGCRVILSSVQDVYAFSDNLKKSRVRHILKKEKDYIQEPKLSGYRSLHLVYQFHSDNKDKDDYNKNMLIEVQVRTRRQHIWATAVETMGLFTKQNLKASQGDEKIKRFFVLISSLFAIKENCQKVHTAKGKKAELIEEVRELEKSRNILSKLKAIQLTLNRTDKIAFKSGYCIMQLDYDKKELRVIYFKPHEIEKANEKYTDLENDSKEKNVDVVLVRASSFQNLRMAYPNYFLDIGEFIHMVETYF